MKECDFYLRLHRAIADAVALAMDHVEKNGELLQELRATPYSAALLDVAETRRFRLTQWDSLRSVLQLLQFIRKFHEHHFNTLLFQDDLHDILCMAVSFYERENSLFL